MSLGDLVERDVPLAPLTVPLRPSRSITRSPATQSSAFLNSAAWVGTTSTARPAAIKADKLR